MLIFSVVILVGAPYLPTLKQRIDDAFDLMSLKKGQTMLELGSGDGRMLIAAAKKGLYSIGYEINPFLVIYSKIVCWKYRKYITVIWGDYWEKEWPKTDAVYVFLLQKYMKKLHNKLIQYTKTHTTKLVSFAFTIEGKKPKKQLKGMRLYVYNKSLKG